LLLRFHQILFLHFLLKIKSMTRRYLSSSITHIRLSLQNLADVFLKMTQLVTIVLDVLLIRRVFFEICNYFEILEH